MSRANYLDGDAIKSAIANVRQDKSEVDYVVVGYEDPTTLKLISTGSGGLASITEHLVEGEARYALLRVNFLHVEPGKELKTIKFVYIDYRSDSLVMKYKMKIGQYEKQLSELFSPYHTDFQISNASEITDEIITKKLEKISGTSTSQISEKKDKSHLSGVHVGSAGYIGGKALPTKDEKKVTEKVAGGAPLAFADPEEPAKSIGLVRRSEHDENWVIFGYADAADKKTLVLKGVGSGLDSMKAAFEPNNVNYALYRLIELVDGKTKAVKFAFIVHIGEVGPMKRGAVSTHKGFVATAFSPYHGDVNISNPEELNDDNLLRAVSSVLKSDVKPRS